MIIKTKLCSDNVKLLELGIEAKEYETSDFEFDLSEVTGIDSPADKEDEFIIFLKGTSGLMIKHDYNQLMKQWKELKKK
jgi:hypothetical protein